MKKIFVGNLSWKVTEEILKPLFEAYGAVVSIKIIVDPVTGKSRGFGFVEMDDAESATKAIAGLNDKPLLERNMRVSLAQPRNDRPPREGGAGGGRERGGERGGYRDDHRSGGERRSYRSHGDRSYDR